MRCTFHVLLAFAIALAALPAFASDPPFYGPQLEGFAYPHPVKRFEFDSPQQKLSMAYMDVAATAEPNGRTVLLLHGQKFCAATSESAIAALAGAGFRVVAVAPVGFCKSSTPRRYPFSFAPLPDTPPARLPPPPH